MKIVKQIVAVLLLACLTFAGILLLKLSLPYIHFKPAVDFLITKQLIYHIKPWRWSFYIHVFTGSILYFTGLIQFIPWIQQNWKRFHRISGYMYIVCVLGITGPSGFIMGLYANGGYPAQASFVLLSLIWFYSTWKALVFARNGNYLKHQQWMIISFALTLSAVTLRLYALIFDIVGLNMHPVNEYILLAWISWVPNLVMAVIYGRSFLNQTKN